AVHSFAPLEFLILPFGHQFDHVTRQPQRLNHVLVEHADAAACNRAHGELRAAGHTELPDHKDIKWYVKRAGNLESNRDSPARERQHDHIRPVRAAFQPVGQEATSLLPISETAWISNG